MDKHIRPKNRLVPYLFAGGLAIAGVLGLNNCVYVDDWCRKTESDKFLASMSPTPKPIQPVQPVQLNWGELKRMWFPTEEICDFETDDITKYKIKYDLSNSLVDNKNSVLKIKVLEAKEQETIKNTRDVRKEGQSEFLVYVVRENSNERSVEEAFQEEIIEYNYNLERLLKGMEIHTISPSNEELKRKHKESVEREIKAIESSMRDIHPGERPGAREGAIQRLKLQSEMFTTIYDYRFKAEPTGRKQAIVISTGEWKNNGNEKYQIYSNKPSRNTKVKIFSNYLGFEQNVVKSDGNGEVEVNIKSTPEGWAFTKEALVDKIKGWKLIKDIKGPIREKLLPSIENKIQSKEYLIRIETVEEWVKDDGTIVNDAKEIYVKGEEVTTDEIYNIIKKFIDEKINSQIEGVTLTVRDDESHTGIPDAKLEMKVQAPTKEDLADDFFEGELLSWAVAQIKDYKRENATVHTNSAGDAEFNIFVPSELEIEAAHPKYHYLKDSVRLAGQKLDKYLEMTELGKKIRIADPDKDKEKKSRIIDK